MNTAGSKLLLIFSLFVCVVPTGAFSQNAEGEGSGPQTYDHDTFQDMIDIPGKMVASKRVIPLIEKKLLPKCDIQHSDKGPDFFCHIDLADELTLRGVPMGHRGQTIEKDLTVHDKARFVVFNTNPTRGTSITVMVFLEGRPTDPKRKSLENTAETRFLAKEIVIEALRDCERSREALTMSYVHYIFDEKYEDLPPGK